MRRGIVVQYAVLFGVQFVALLTRRVMFQSGGCAQWLYPGFAKRVVQRQLVSSVVVDLPFEEQMVYI